MRTEIATLGEFGLIDRLTEGIKPENESTKYGVGDDAAVLSYPSEKQLLVTTDLLMEGVHFDLTYVPLKHLGYKSAVVNFSDIYAMNGTPRQITVSLALSKRFSVEDMEAFVWHANSIMLTLSEAIHPLLLRDLPSASPVSEMPIKTKWSTATEPKTLT